ncbi:uncharacterized protein LOC9653362 [Selaginella moellendorffii]|nr:uncharacterized protein LOC9653362 [Selaginella moellendorffii]XP_024515251.1 uncharacterized protein LOC9653362 [Selaginella moellendorffii]|eukprot:XP_024515250.1 uncharacterized protein LOC9653362 [Selaginella moellendorffii]
MEESLFDDEERPIKRKVRFHPAGEERVKRQQLEGAEFFLVPDEITNASRLWQWIKQINPNVRARLTPQGWMAMVGSSVRDGPLPHEFDLHFREALSARVEWMEDLVSRIDNWSDAILTPDNVITPLPWPFVPVDDSTAAASDFKLRVLDLGDNDTLQSIWGKESAVKILERECYKELWEVGVKPLFEQNRRVAILVLGNPGIGKTGFLLHVLVILLKEKRKVLLRTKGGSLYYFNPDAAGNYHTSMVGSYSEARLDRDRDLVFLADEKLPDVPVFLGKALLASTPLRSNYKDYENDAACRKFFLPVWPSRELSLLRQVVFPDKDLQATNERYKQWGGIPRYVLEITSDDLVGIIQRMPALADVVTATSSGAVESDHPSHKALYLRVRDNYKSYDLQYASPFVRRTVYEKLHRDQVNTLRAFVSFRGTALEGFAALKGGILQEHFRNISQNAKLFRVCEVFEDVATKSTGPLMQEFAFGKPVTVWSVDDLTSPYVYDSIVWPENPIEDTLDALLLTKNAAKQDVLQLFQVTVTSGRHAHGLKYNGLLRVMDNFKVPPARVDVYIVTTNDLFADAGWQNWRIKNNNVLADKKIKQRLIGIRQFALDSNA